MWQLNKLEIETLLKGASKLTPSTSKHKKCQLYTIDYIAKLKEKMDLNNYLNAAVFACLTTCFYATG